MGINKVPESAECANHHAAWSATDLQQSCKLKVPPAPAFGFNMGGEEDKGPEDNTSIEHIWGSFRANTSAHCIPQYNSARGPVKKTFWVMVAFACIGTLTYHFYYLIDKYYKSESVVIVNIESASKLRFPAVTLCNNNILRRSLILGDTHLRALVSDAHSVNGTLNYTRAFFLQEQLMSAIADLPPDRRMLLSHQKEDLIVSCQFAGVKCRDRDFGELFSSSYGNCYTFNWGVNADELQYFSNRPVPQYGLILLVNVEQYMYVPVTEAAGVRVVIHPHGTMPFPEDEGISVSPGHQSSIALRQTSIERLGGKYSGCVEEDNENMENIFRERYGVRYSTKACEGTCYQMQVVDSCQCADLRFPFPVGDPVIEACNINNPSQYTCQAFVNTLRENGNLSCSCPRSCREDTYSLSLSTLTWPAELHKPMLYQELRHLNVTEFNELADNEDLRSAFVDENLVKLVIYFEDFNYEQIRDIPSYDTGQFISDLGGILGLYIGFSVMTVLEIWELIVDISFSAIYKLGNTNNDQKVHDIVEELKE